MSATPAAREVVLALADDEACLAHWYATWVGLGPFLEEDLATTSIGQDELGHARALYGVLEPDGDLDALAYGRLPVEVRSCWLAELEVVQWEDLLVRHLLYDEAETVRWEAFTTSTLPGLAAVAERALDEEAYHTRHARSLFTRLMAGGPDAAQRLTASLGRLLPLATGLFEPTAGDEAAVAEGICAAPAGELRAEWRRRVDSVARAAGARLDWPELPTTPMGRRGVRSEGFPAMYAEMTRVYALDPTARW